MTLDIENRTLTFQSAYKLLLRTAKRSVYTLNTEPTNLALFCQTLSDIREKDTSKIHIVGRGRSGLIGRIIGESLKNINFSVFYLGDDLSRPINKNDVVIAVTGSGWTKFTNSAIEEGVRKRAKILTFTGNPESKASKLADATIQIPIGFKPNNDLQLFSTRKAPLSPLGSIFELTTFVIGIGIINGIYTGSCTYGFDQGTNVILKEAKKCLNALQQESSILKIMKNLSSYFSQSEKKVFLTGSGINELISNIIAIRLQNLMINVFPLEDWRFREEGDLLISISGSGSSTSTVNLIKSAKKSKMNIIGISSFPQSELAKLSDIFLCIKGRTESVNSNGITSSKARMYLPIFEYLTALTLESCVAQMAIDLEISSDLADFRWINVE